MARSSRSVGHWASVSAAALGLLLDASALSGQAAAGQAPQGEISGRLTYRGTGLGVAQALVVIPEAGLGAVTDAQGRYRIEAVPAGVHEVAPTLLGCQLASRIVQVGPGRRVEASFDLSTPVINLQGLVVTAVATRTPASDLPFSVARVDPSTASSARSMGTLIQGRIAGAHVLFGSGQPGSEPSILLRGPQSIQGSQAPLVVVDGVVTSDGVADLDPMDVESVEVLKGAAAAAGYGARGERGVIEIRTKRGPGSRPRPTGPLVIVDGHSTGGTLADVDITEIEDIRKLDGPAAAVLYGPDAERGVILVSTRGAPPEASRPPFCAVPKWLR